MTNEEAIKELQSYAEHSWVNLNEAFEMAISAIRQQETVTKCNDLFDEDGGEILNDETVTDRHQMTNAQKIRAMSDEELAGFLLKLMGNVQCFGEGMFPYHPCPQDQNCKQCGIDWLQQPAGEEDKHEPTG